MKRSQSRGYNKKEESPPVRGAWIETPILKLTLDKPVSPPVRGAWIETYDRRLHEKQDNKSPPVRGAWIETRRCQPPNIPSSRRPPCGGRGLKPYGPRPHLP